MPLSQQDALEVKKEMQLRILSSVSMPLSQQDALEDVANNHYQIGLTCVSMPLSQQDALEAFRKISSCQLHLVSMPLSQQDALEGFNYLVYP